MSTDRAARTAAAAAGLKPLPAAEIARIAEEKDQPRAALSVAAVGAFAAKVIETADAIGDLSEQLNISTDDVQRLQILAPDR